MVTCPRCKRAVNPAPLCLYCGQKLVAGPISIQGRDAAQWLHEAQRVLAMGQLDRALKAVEHALEIAPDSAAAKQLRTHILARQARPAAPPAHPLGAAPSTDGHAQAIASNPVVLARALAGQGEHQAAIVLLTEALRVPGFLARPESAVVLVQRGCSHKELGALPLALADFRAACKANPGYALAPYNIADVLDDMGQTEAALAAIDEALRIDPRYGNAWSNRGYLLRKLQRDDEALTAYRTALRFDDKNPNTWHNLAVVLAARGERGEAIPAAERAMALSPRSQTAQLLEGLRAAASTVPDFAKIAQETIAAHAPMVRLSATPAGVFALDVFLDLVYPAATAAHANEQAAAGATQRRVAVPLGILFGEAIRSALGARWVLPPAAELAAARLHVPGAEPCAAVEAVLDRIQNGPTKRLWPLFVALRRGAGLTASAHELPDWLAHADDMERVGRADAALLFLRAANDLPLANAQRSALQLRIGALEASEAAPPTPADEAPAVSPSPRSTLALSKEELRARAQDDARAGRHDEALAALNAAARVDPKDHTVWLDIGLVCVARGDLDEALGAFCMARTLNPDDPLGYDHGAVTLGRLKSISEGLSLLDEGIARLPNAGALWMRKGVLLALSGELASALAALARATSLEPALAAAWVFRLDVEQRLGRYPEALASFRAWEGIPKDAISDRAGPQMQANGRVLAGLCALDADVQQRVAAALSRLSGGVPKPQALAQVAADLAPSVPRAVAVAVWQLVRAAEPTHVEATLAVAELLLPMGRIDEAAQLLHGLAHVPAPQRERDNALRKKAGLRPRPA